MHYYLYYHHDLDGIASGAILLNFLLARGDDYASCNSLDYASNIKRHWQEFVFKRPAILVDFMYHPDADVWFDHHPTAFVKNEWKEQFQPSPWKQYDTSQKSCCGLITRFLKAQHRYNIPAHLQQLVSETDIFDSSTFASVDDVVGFDTVAKKINCLNDLHVDKKQKVQADAFKESLIRLVATESSFDFLDKPEFKKTYDKAAALERDAIEIIKKHGVVNGRILFVDGVQYDVPNMHSLPLYVFRDCWYQVIIGRKDEYYKVRMSRNNWQRPNSPVNLGMLALEKDPQGGGHAGIGVMFRKTEEEARTLARELIEYLNKNG